MSMIDNNCDLYAGTSSTYLEETSTGRPHTSVSISATIRGNFWENAPFRVMDLQFAWLRTRF